MYKPLRYIKDLLGLNFFKQSEVSGIEFSVKFLYLGNNLYISFLSFL